MSDYAVFIEELRTKYTSDHYQQNQEAQFLLRRVELDTEMVPAEVSEYSTPMIQVLKVLSDNVQDVELSLLTAAAVSFLEPRQAERCFKYLSPDAKEIYQSLVGGLSPVSSSPKAAQLFAATFVNYAKTIIEDGCEPSELTYAAREGQEIKKLIETEVIKTGCPALDALLFQASDNLVAKVMAASVPATRASRKQTPGPK